MNLKDALEKTTALQSTLYQAAKADSSRRFYRLYDKLYREDVLQVAWERVRRNRGVPGPDGVIIGSIEQSGVPAYLAQLQTELREQTYRPSPVRRVQIPKNGGKLRDLGIPNVRDRIVQAAAKLILEPIFEADFSGNSYGFRPGIGQSDALASVDASAHQGYRWVVDADIEGFFDNLDHDRLMEALRRRISDGAVLRLIYRWLKAGVLFLKIHENTDRGTPQGGVLSPLLANVYLHSLDVSFERQNSFIGRLTRYCDDFVIQCGTRLHADRALCWVRDTLAFLKLGLHPDKTKIVNDREDGYDFLGFHHRRVLLLRSTKRREMPMRWPSTRSCQRYRDRLKSMLEASAGVRGAAEWRILRDELNRYIVGFGQYFRNGQSTRVLRGLDDYTRQRVARYLCRQQPRGKKRRARKWTAMASWLRDGNHLRQLSAPKSKWPANVHRGLANVQWKAV
jgi:RNA-directed DNA polymerase